MKSGQPSLKGGRGRLGQVSVGCVKSGQPSLKGVRAGLSRH